MCEASGDGVIGGAMGVCAGGADGSLAGAYASGDVAAGVPDGFACVQKLLVVDGVLEPFASLRESFPAAGIGFESGVADREECALSAVAGELREDLRGEWLEVLKFFEGQLALVELSQEGFEGRRLVMWRGKGGGGFVVFVRHGTLGVGGWGSGLFVSWSLGFGNVSMGAVGGWGA